MNIINHNLRCLACNCQLPLYGNVDELCIRCRQVALCDFNVLEDLTQHVDKKIKEIPY